MDNKKLFIVLVGGAAIGANQVHESHFEQAIIERSLASQPAMDAPFYGVLPHGDHPDHPGGPFRTAWTVAISTATYAPTVATPRFVEWPSF